jgi:hypothetical protein
VERILRNLHQNASQTDQPTAQVPVCAEPLLVPARDFLTLKPDEDNHGLARIVPANRNRTQPPSVLD